jgi:exonuclease SbcD
MRLLHTADWHLNDRLGRIPRQPDIVARLEEIAAYLETYSVDVMLVAGDLFSQHTRLEELRDAVSDVNRIFKPFLLRGGTIVAISGNHDNDAFLDLLRLALGLAEPIDARQKGPRPGRRMYLASGPTSLLLADKTEQQVQFVLMPYPSVIYYLKREQVHYASLEERNVLLHQAFLRRLQALEKTAFAAHPRYILIAHLHVRGKQAHNLYHITKREDVIFDMKEISGTWDYVALGHIHKSQALSDISSVHYACSIERLDESERDEQKSVVLLDIGPNGLVSEPECLPLHATPIYHIAISDPATDIPRLQHMYKDAQRALVSYRLEYTPGVDDRESIVHELERIFPRWYKREIVPRDTDNQAAFDDVSEQVTETKQDVASTVKAYVQQRMADNPERGDVLALLDELLKTLR